MLEQKTVLTLYELLWRHLQHSSTQHTYFSVNYLYQHNNETIQILDIYTPGVNI